MATPMLVRKVTASYPHITMKSPINSTIGVKILSSLLLFSSLSVHAWTSKLFPFDSTTGEYEYKTIPANDGWTAQPNWKLIDFSYAGYEANDSPIPSPAVKVVVNPGQSIQNAINQVAAMPKDSSGFRGAVLIKAGTYTITAEQVISTDGIVIRGEGADKTFIYVNSSGFANKSAIRVKGTWNLGTAYSLLSDVQMGSSSIQVTNASNFFKAGDLVLVDHERNSAFLNEHHMDGVQYWPNELSVLRSFFKIKSVSGNVITFTEPFTYRMRTAWKARVRKASTNVHHVGVENLSIGFKQGTGAMGSNTPTDNSHMVLISNAANVWIRGVNSYRPSGATNHIHSNGLKFSDVKWGTMENCDVRSAYNVGEGGNGYKFCPNNRCDDILFKNCHAEDGRHLFSVNGACSRVVFSGFTGNGHDYRTDKTNGSNDTHRYLARGILVENSSFIGHSWVCFSNRGLNSTGAGFTGTETFMWNCQGSNVGEGTNRVPSLMLMSSIGRQYAIGTYGERHNVQHLNTSTSMAYEEGIGQSGLEPASLFDAQLRIRHNGASTTSMIAPTFKTQPVSATIKEGQTATFTVTATGNPAPTYQWKKNGTIISGATSSSYTTPSTTLSDNGAQFTVVISNSVGSKTSSIATLTVNQLTVAPQISTQPLSQSVVEGQLVTFSVTASGTPSPSYQWKKNGAAIVGATASSYSISSTLANNGSQFSVTVSNSAGSITSNLATLTVQPLPVNAKINNFTLVDATTDVDIGILSNGSTLNLATLPSRSLNVRANVSSGTLGSIAFKLSGPSSLTQIENAAPYAMVGGSTTDYNGYTFLPGTYTLTATAYSSSGGAGTAGTPYQITFNVIDQDSTMVGSITGFTLINADTDQPIQTISNSAAIKLSSLPTMHLNVRVNTSGTVGSVKINVAGIANASRVENGAPYSVFGDASGNYTAWTPALGSYTLTAVPYNLSNAQGVAGNSSTITFTVY